MSGARTRFGPRGGSAPRKTAPPAVLAFGGFDPSGGAGVLMDAKAVGAAGGYAVAVPSCLAVQTPDSFDRIVPLPGPALDRALEAAAKSHDVRVVKVGVVGTQAAARSILQFLARRPGLPLVLDPVLRASSGALLLRRSALPAYRALLARADVLTPNLQEAEKILGRRIREFAGAVLAARDLSLACGGAAVLLKGGHFPWRGRRGTDVLFEDGRTVLVAPGRAAARRDAHGTGCALASMIAARLACGDPLADAVRTAKGLLEEMIAAGFPAAGGRWTLHRAAP